KIELYDPVMTACNLVASARIKGQADKGAPRRVRPVNLCADREGRARRSGLVRSRRSARVANGLSRRSIALEIADRAGHEARQSERSQPAGRRWSPAAAARPPPARQFPHPRPVVEKTSL